MPWVVGGGIVAAAGVGAFIVGAAPFFAYQGASSRLSQLQATVGSDATAAKTNAAEIKTQESDLVTARNAWETYSGPAMIGGVAAVLAGAAIIAAPFVVE